jgi:hypothetical protein
MRFQCYLVVAKILTEVLENLLTKNFACEGDDYADVISVVRMVTMSVCGIHKENFK